MTTAYPLLLFLLALAPFSGLLATVYLIRVWWIRPRSILVGLLTCGAVITEVTAFLIAPLAWNALVTAGLQNRLNPAAAQVGIALLIQLAIPHAYAVSIYLLRRRMGQT